MKRILTLRSPACSLCQVRHEFQRTNKNCHTRHLVFHTPGKPPAPASCRNLKSEQSARISRVIRFSTCSTPPTTLCFFSHSFTTVGHPPQEVLRREYLMQCPQTWVELVSPHSSTSPSVRETSRGQLKTLLSVSRNTRALQFNTFTPHTRPFRAHASITRSQNRTRHIQVRSHMDTKRSRTKEHDSSPVY